jgi:hypothetical protein
MNRDKIHDRNASQLIRLGYGTIAGSDHWLGTYSLVRDCARALTPQAIANGRGRRASRRAV